MDTAHAVIEPLRYTERTAGTVIKVLTIDKKKKNGMLGLIHARCIELY